LSAKNIKSRIHEVLVEELEFKVDSYKGIISTIKESKNDDTKSSAGDKFETGREMMQVELDKAEMQLNKVNYSLEILNQIKDKPKSETVEIGSLVVCDSGTYYISIGHGKVMVDGVKYYAISLASPIGQLLSRKRIGDDVKFNNKTITISEIH